MVAVFLDIEKAYDTMWRFISQIGEHWNKWQDVQLHFTFFKVRNGISEDIMVESGIPQGSVITPILFNLIVYLRNLAIILMFCCMLMMLSYGRGGRIFHT